MHNHLIRIIFPVVLLLISVPTGAQETQKEDDRFLQFTDGLYDMGTEWGEIGCPYQANWYFGHAYVAVASLRTAIADIARDLMKDKEHAELDESVAYAQEMLSDGDGDFLNELGFDSGSFLDLLSGLSSFARTMEDVGGKMVDKLEDFTDKMGGVVFKADTDNWLVLKSKCLASPYPDFFRGLVLDWRGEDDAATEFYGKAAANPYFIGFQFDFSYLADMEYEDLVALSKKLKPYQSKYGGAMTPDSFYFPYDIVTWSDDYLTSLAIEEIQSGCSDMKKIQEYVEAAYHANPFNVRNIYNCLSVFAECRDVRSTMKYFNEAVRMDGDNEAIPAVVEKLKTFEK